MGSIATIESNPSITILDVKEQEAAYKDLRDRFSEKYQRLANLSCAIYFDLEVDSKLWRPLADYSLGKRMAQTPQLEHFTNEIVKLETQLNITVYETFGLDDDEITLIEQETKYQYGEW